jgi:hypothetical protein
MSRQVPLAIELPTGEVNLTTIDDEPLDPVTAGRYKAIIEKAIVTHDQQNQETLAEAKVQPSGGMQRAPITTPTRDQSIQPERTEPKLKTRGVAAENNDTPAIPSADKSSEARPISGVRISGATLENITDLLGDQNIKDIPPSQIALKLDFLLKKAEETGTSFGRQAPLVGVRGADKVTLRELKWITGAGHRQIRIYFEDNGRGQLTLCGIYDKRGANSHLNNLKKLVTKLERG